MTTDLILGTAGHIDHGKTTLIGALTGVDTDRLPEEKRRGITIDLGFAELMLGDYRLGIVDVPGHERFVRNMLAGATGIDLALLVVAADDSVKPQTLEHLDILRLLDLDTGVIAITKCDMADPNWIDLVEEEVREITRDTFFANAPIVRTSATTGDGIDSLREALLAAAEQAAGANRRARLKAPFRMAIDRAFTIEGHGTVVTGSVSSGRVSAGDQLVIEPGDLNVRVRSVQNHDRPADEVHRGQRAALNLAGLDRQQIRRGQELVAPGGLSASRLLTVTLRLLPAAPRPLKSRTRIRLHVGAAEILASVVLLDCEQLKPGESAPAQLFLSDPAATSWSQPFVARSESPVITIGGGVVLDPQAEKLPKNDETALAQLKLLTSADETERSGAAAYFFGLRDWRPNDLFRSAGVRDANDAHERLVAGGVLCEIQLSPTRKMFVHQLVVRQVCGRIESVLRKMHEQNPLRSMLDTAQLTAAFEYLGEPNLLQHLLQQMSAEGTIRTSDRGIALVGCGPKLTKNEQKLLDQLVADFQSAGLESPTIEQCRQSTSKNRQSVPQLLALAAANGDLVEVAAEYYLHRDVEQHARDVLAANIAGGAGLTVSEIREILQTTRKYAVPLCEYFDRIGFTTRRGDVRVLAKEA